MTIRARIEIDLMDQIKEIFEINQATVTSSITDKINTWMTKCTNVSNLNYTMKRWQQIKLSQNFNYKRETVNLKK